MMAWRGYKPMGVLSVLTLCVPLGLAQNTHAQDGTTTSSTTLVWQNSEGIQAPDFNAAFPWDSAAAEQLKKRFNPIRWRNNPPADGIERIRHALRATTDTAPLLQWIGGEYIAGKAAQDARAIEVMYQASDATNTQTRAAAVEFGLTQVHPKNEAILAALARAALRSEDPALLTSIARLPAEEREGVLAFCKPALESADQPLREAAQARAKIIRGELEAQAWAREAARVQAQARYGNQLETIREQLSGGTSAIRLETLRLTRDQQLALIMDASFIEAFAAAARDADPTVRGLTARLVGEELIDKGGMQTPEAIALMLDLSRDADRRVRTQALQSGLAAIHEKNRVVVERLLELRIADSNEPELLDRIDASLGRSKPLIETVLAEWMNQVEARPMKAVLGFGLWQQLLKSDPPAPEALQAILFGQEKTVAGIAEINTTQTYSPATLDELFTTLAAALPPELRDCIATVDDSAYPVLLLETSQTVLAREALSADGRLQLGRVQARSAVSILKIAEGYRPPED